ncbi:AfsA-related hotdog domain-containing protein [Pseudoalteromonas sp. S16_S37]|uniref:AfsA-related hotdog domain-containing protein n=1 Tax=Pseudoalteromonas sp. S16_S37 TaxID=2720228 RepID=UPI0016802C0F|nr:AfsA-related hotdog domain-containing protein [Pseudoalteromonas sp. S16_S37]MBD1582313.1 hypothetical protein [Pseudoalteromonas sp. S16_S37]
MSIIPTITPKLLHKHKDDDVLLSSPRKLLPARFVSAQTHPATDPAIVMLNSLYDVSADNEYTLRVPADSSERAGVPYKDVITQAANELMRGVPHQVIEAIKAGLPQDSAERLDVSDEAIAAFLLHHQVTRHSHSFKFVNQAEHYFFYRKPHEHVPGIMLLEAARQTIYYQLYGFSQQQLGKVTVSLSELNAKFYHYAELMYPMEIVVDDLTAGDIQKPKEVLYSASFYQQGMLIARINSLAPVISLKRFVLARNAKLLNEDERFSPLPVAPITTLLSSTAGKQVLVELQTIGITACTTSPFEADNNDAVYLNVIYGNKLHFQTQVQLQRHDDGSAFWSFLEVDHEQRETLKEIIKRGFVSNPQQAA